MDALDLAVVAQTDPVKAIRDTLSHLADAITLSDVDFDVWALAETVRQTSVVLALAADGLKRHALSRPFVQRRPTHEQVAEIHTAIDVAEEDGSSALWKAI